MSNVNILPHVQSYNLDANRYTSQYDRLDNYNDINALQSLKYQSKTDKDSALDQAAKHFESIFVSMMVKSMRDANKVFSEGNMLQSNESEFYQQMFDSQLSVSLSTGRGIGLADVIKRQLSKDQGVPTINIPEGGIPLHGHANRIQNDSSEKRLFSLENYLRMPFVSSEQKVELEETAESIDALLADLTLQDDINKSVESQIEMTPVILTEMNPLAGVEVAVETVMAPVKQTPVPPVAFNGPQQFIETLYPYAKEVERKTGIDARLMLAQSALETGWGKRPILKQDGTPSFNLFGIKATSAWQGDAAHITTTEYRGGLAMKEKASFRAYASYEDSFNDYAHFLKTNSRYQEALSNKGQPKAFARELQEAGYATDPNYARKIGSIVDNYFEDIGKTTGSSNTINTLKTQADVRGS